VPRYLLKETPNGDYGQRTEWNVRGSDGTVIFSVGERLTGGSLRTWKFAVKHKKPHLLVSAASSDGAASKLRAWLEENDIHVLNVAGPRASKEPGLGRFVASVLSEALK
jgi:hypothetical protein